MSLESIRNSRCYKIAQRLTGLGIAIAPGYPGDRSSYFNDCQNQATTDMAKVEEWMTTGYPLPDGLHVVTDDHNWICMAKRGGVGCLDIDDYAECLKQGMPPILDSDFIVDTPGGGLHVLFNTTHETDMLGNRAVRRDPNDTGSEKIFELKVHNVSWCGPWQERKENPGVRYQPRNGRAPVSVLSTEQIAWVIKHSTGHGVHETTDWDFHDDWDQEAFLDHNQCDYQDEWDDKGTVYVNVTKCPVCDEESRQSGRGGQVKFMFSGRGYGFTCKFCGIEGEGARKIFEEKMAETYADWTPWREAIYAGGFELPDETFVDQDDLVEVEIPKPFTALFPKATETTVAPTVPTICQAPMWSGCTCMLEHANQQRERTTEELNAEFDAAQAAKKAPPTPVAPTVDLTEDYAAKLLAIVLGDPTTEKDFVFYRKRLSECVRVLAGRRDKDKQAVSAVQSKALDQLLAFEWEYKKLPTATEFGAYVLEHASKAAPEIVGLVEHLPDVAGLTLDFVAPKLISQCKTWQEKALWQKAFPLLDKDIAQGRALLQSGWRDTAVWGETVRTVGGALQENTDQILARFTALLPENQQPGVTTSFTSPFPTLNDAFGLNSADRLLAFIASDSNFKTAVVTNCAHHMATEGKNVLFVTGEHEAEMVEDRLVWMFRKFIGEDVQLTLRDWNDRNGTRAELRQAEIALQQLKEMREMPGFIMVKRFDDADFGSGLDGILDYMEGSFDKYQWDVLVLDPFETLCAGVSPEDAWGASKKMGQQLKATTVGFHNSEGLVVLTTFQLHSKSKDGVAKVQGSPTAMLEDYEEALRMGSLNMFTWAPDVFDGLLGVARIQNWESTGVITFRRLRFGHRFQPFIFNADLKTFLMTEAGAVVKAEIEAHSHTEQGREQKIKDDKAALKKYQNRKMEPWKGDM